MVFFYDVLIVFLWSWFQIEKERHESIPKCRLKGLYDSESGEGKGIYQTVRRQSLNPLLYKVNVYGELYLAIKMSLHRFRDWKGVFWGSVITRRGGWRNKKTYYFNWFYLTPFSSSFVVVVVSKDVKINIVVILYIYIKF